MEIRNTLLNSQCVKEKTSQGIRKYFEMKGKEDTICQNLWEAAKTVKNVQLQIPTFKKERTISNQQLSALRSGGQGLPWWPSG